MTWQQIERIRKKYQRIHRKKVYDALMDQLQEALKVIGEGSLENLPEKIKQVVSDKMIKKVFYNLYADVGWEFYRAFKVKKDAERSLWDEWIKEIIEQETGMRITLITDYSREILMATAKSVLQMGQDQGLGIMEMERLMRETLSTDYKQMSRMRALRIVQTETMTASNFATLRAGQNAGIKMRKVWMTAPWGVARKERHNLYPELQEQRPMDGQPFRFGMYAMQYPGDPSGGPENTINCRCCLSWEPLEDQLIF